MAVGLSGKFAWSISIGKTYRMLGFFSGIKNPKELHNRRNDIIENYITEGMTQ